MRKKAGLIDQLMWPERARTYVRVRVRVRTHRIRPLPNLRIPCVRCTCTRYSCIYVYKYEESPCVFSFTLESC